MSDDSTEHIAPESPQGERIAKVIARAGVCSRRDAEKLIAEGRVTLNGETVTTPAIKVGENDVIAMDGKPLAEPEPARLWRYHKPSGLVTTHKDPKGRPTVFANLPKSMPRVVSVGRLDFNSEGLLLLTNDGEIARRLEMPASGWVRKYRVRLFGKVTQADLDKLATGITIDGVKYGPIIADLERSKGMYSWAHGWPEGRQEPRDQAGDGAAGPESGAPDPRALRPVPAGPSRARTGRGNPRQAVARATGHRPQEARCKRKGAQTLGKLITSAPAIASPRSSP